jgi:hypothetical protein
LKIDERQQQIPLRGMTERKQLQMQKRLRISFRNDRKEGRDNSGFPEGMTERKTAALL